ncbi:MAG: hypothetical protein EBZ59_10705, partial [Planctomycetia bacterium]|nr:hypothetical protein [Planctomycetia bacterium]
DPLGYPQALAFKVGKGFEGGPPARGERFLLHPRHQDYNTDRIVAYLEACDRDGGGLYQDFLRDPEQAAALVPLPNEVERRSQGLLPALGLTPSQAHAFRELRRRRVLAVWGPPGTGKTHFLATAVVALAEAHARAGLPFRVLVTAFTHNAIENVLATSRPSRRPGGPRSIWSSWTRRPRCACRKPPSPSARSARRAGSSWRATTSNCRRSFRGRTPNRRRGSGSSTARSSRPRRARSGAAAPSSRSCSRTGG